MSERVAILTRISDGDQSSHSLDAQTRQLRDLAAVRGWQIVAECEGPGESAFTNEIEKRKALIPVLALAESRAIDAILYHESSRLARDEELAHWLINRCTAWGVRLVNASRPDTDYTTPDGRFLYAIDAGLDAYFSRKIGAHVRKANAELFAAGLTTRPPVGYRLRADGRGVEVDEREAEGVREAFRMRAAGARYADIAAMLNAREIRPRSRIRGYQRFVIAAMQSLLGNDFYAGWLRHNGERKRGAHEPLITDAEFDAAHRMRKSRVARTNRSHRRPLAADVAYCVRCGGRMYAVHNGTAARPLTSYRDTSAIRGNDCETAGMSIVAHTVDESISDLVRSLGVRAGDLAAAAERAVAPQDADPTRTRAELEAAKLRYTDAYGTGVITRDQWAARIGQLDAELARIESASASSPSAAKAAIALRSFADAWDGMTDDERRQCVGVLIERVAIDVRGEIWIAPRPEFAALFAAAAANKALTMSSGAQTLKMPSNGRRRVYRTPTRDGLPAVTVPPGYYPLAELAA